MEDMFSGEARGCGWQASAAAANLGAFYIVSLPAAIALAFVYNLKSDRLVHRSSSWHHLSGCHIGYLN